VIISSLIAGEIAKWLWMKRTSYASQPTERILLNFPLISGIAFFLWISYFAVFGDNIHRIFNWFAGEVTAVPRVETELKPVLELSFWEKIELFFKMYGSWFILAIFSLFALFIIFRYFIRRQREIRELFILSSLFLTGLIVYTFLFLSVQCTTFGRLFSANIAMWAIPVLAGFALYELFKTPRVSKALGIMIVVLILTTSSILGVFSVYRSPWINQINWQITRMDISGSIWFDSHKVEDFSCAPMGWMRGDYKIPAHFGYSEHEKVGELIEKDSYILLAERFKQASENPVLKEWINMPAEFARIGFEKGDFVRIEHDPSISKLYSNREFEVWLVSPEKGGTS
jgi:hypothetical protein